MDCFGEPDVIGEADALLICGQGQSGNIPLADQALGAVFAASGGHSVQVLRIIDVDRDPGQRKHDAWFSRGLGGGVMRLETVVAEAGGEQAGGTPKNGVGAASVGGGNQDGAFRRRGRDDLFEFPRLDQWNVAGNYQSAFNSVIFAEAGCTFDGIGLAAIGLVGDYVEIDRRVVQRKDRW